MYIYNLLTSSEKKTNVTTCNHGEHSLLFYSDSSTAPFDQWFRLSFSKKNGAGWALSMTRKKVPIIISPNDLGDAQTTYLAEHDAH